MSNLAQIRKKAGLTQYQIADALGWNQPRIANYEKGIRTPSVNDCHKLVSFFANHGVKTSINELFPPVAN
ncbi:helix-turn-helix transcriptional regulator [Pasteurellaceae bacterium 20609_3]|uniref:helix-turn-helix transcriptional regulator n=1 Tax=Spirabiliibacterium mucosae TaxID=28156 RepID=UPI001AADE157|nr:helix-turn-helix transcriptional regulator [Spirabiliibacterium mucosae]MBE2898108.1 helix-turn-helix transcriptional regulator [Spirabiliibacterium mucosae]